MGDWAFWSIGYQHGLLPALFGPVAGRYFYEAFGTRDGFAHAVYDDIARRTQDVLVRSVRQVYDAAAAAEAPITATASASSASRRETNGNGARVIAPCRAAPWRCGPCPKSTSRPGSEKLRQEKYRSARVQSQRHKAGAPRSTRAPTSRRNPSRSTP